MRRVNREKSLTKIAELTKQHKLDKEQKQKRMEEDLSGSEGEKEEESKTQAKSLHK